MRASLSTYTALLADSLCGGSSRRLIAGWWYVGDLDFDPIWFDMMCCMCLSVLCAWSVRCIMSYCQTHIIGFCERNETCPRVFFLSSRSNFLPKYFRLEQQGFIFNLIPHAYYAIFFSNRCTTVISYYIYI
jgi:hypothetical protein